jgi:hypothetical protein
MTVESAIANRSSPLRLALRAVPLGTRLLPRLPERTTQRVLGRILGRWPELWGLSDDGEHVRSTRQAFRLAFPAEDADRFVQSWLTARGNALAISLDYMARWLVGRKSRMVRLRSSFRLQGPGPFVVVCLHYSLEPVIQLAVLAAHPDLSFRWPIYPVLPNIEDYRVLWLSRSKLPSRVAITLLSIADAKWAVDVLAHLRGGGSLLMALDAPLDGHRRANTTIAIGELRVPIAPSIEIFVRMSGAQLVYASPRREPDGTWTLDLVHVADIEELAALAAEWILTHREEWAGWPYVVWREEAAEMRRTIVMSSPPDDRAQLAS